MSTVRNEALDRLNEAFEAAEAWLFRRNYGCKAVVRIGASGDTLGWDRLKGDWVLVVTPVSTETTVHISGAPASLRVLAAHELPELARTLQLRSIDEMRNIEAAIEQVLAFSKQDEQS